ncbi:helix-turn-helix domain-containing protein [Neogemmobacter tilapiae]|uniref:AraC family transcriptional regulator n=1 Tax=Neogemmobacter tilapiae TaxID=875041 RepID=A0A918TIL3_9RHOB|nr:AraC family transcriptional regulator [Gemmobacter tilapiae]GHC49316.1 AraC family transcriptional regulator [Gemmobacter tilapiae]
MKAYLEHLTLPPDASWAMLNRRLADGIPFQWHHHPEWELTLTLNSHGQRFIGDHVGEYGPGDLVLVGPNLPHTWASRGKDSPALPHVALVFWFRQEWVEGLLAGSVEGQAINQMLARGKGGLAFDAALGQALAAEYESIYAQPPMARLLGLLAILDRLAHAESVPLSPTLPHAPPENRQRIDRVLTHLHLSYAEPVRLEALAEIAALSLSGLHRLFRKHTQSSVTDYVIRLRVGEACARLSGSDQPIQHVAADVGYTSMANFNRQFRALRGMTPREYRALFRK